MSHGFALATRRASGRTLTGRAMVSAAVIPAMLACACTTTIGPRITAGPGWGKSVGEWEADKRECMAGTDASLQPVADAMNAGAVTIGRMEAVNARLQAMYDASYGSCLLARNDLVPAPAIPLRGVPVPPTPEAALVGGQRAIDASTTPGLSDRESLDAERFVAGETRDLRAACPGDTVRLDAHDAPLSPGTVARLVGLTEPHGGDCLGSMGELDYLVARRPSGWATLLSGYLGILGTSHAGFRDVESRSRGACVFEFAWTGASYAVAGSNGCDADAPPTSGGPDGKSRGR